MLFLSGQVVGCNSYLFLFVLTSSLLKHVITKTMSVFLKNDCKYSNCGKVFLTLHELIIHIENEHIDFDPCKIEQTEIKKPDNLPLSYVLKFGNYTEQTFPTPEGNKLHFSNNRSVIDNSSGNCTYGCDFKEKKLLHDNVMINTPRLNTVNCVPKYSNQRLYHFDNGHKKPFICPVPGCYKRYKNVNGVKYHYKNFHRIGGYTSTYRKYKSHNKDNVGNVYEKQNVPLLNLSPNMYTHIHNNMLNRAITGAPNMQLYGESMLDMLSTDCLYDFTTTTNITTTSNEFNVPNQVPLPNPNFNYYDIPNNNIKNGYEGNFQPNITSNYVPNNLNCYQ